MKKQGVIVICVGICLLAIGGFVWKNFSPQFSNSGVEQKNAEKVLVDFFDFLVKEDYTNAVKIFYPLDENEKYSWESITQYKDPEKQKSTKEEELKYYCSAVGTCLQVQILSGEQKSIGDYIFTVQFKNADGSLFLYGPFGGVTEKESPPQTKFQFEVKNIQWKYKVVTLPLYRP